MRLCSCGDDGLIRGWKWKEFTESEIPVSTQVCFYCHTVNVFSELSSFIDIFRGPWGALSPIPENDAIALGTQETTKIKTAFKGHLDYLHCIVPATLPTRKLSQKLSPGYCLQEVITGSEDGTARIWDCKSGKCIRVIDQGKDKNLKRFCTSVRCIALDSSDSWLACSSGQSLSVWNLHASECVSRTSTSAYSITTKGILLLLSLNTFSSEFPVSESYINLVWYSGSVHCDSNWRLRRSCRRDIPGSKPLLHFPLQSSIKRESENVYDARKWACEPIDDSKGPIRMGRGVEAQPARSTDPGRKKRDGQKRRYIYKNRSKPFAFSNPFGFREKAKYKTIPSRSTAAANQQFSLSRSRLSVPSLLTPLLVRRTAQNPSSSFLRRDCSSSNLSNRKHTVSDMAGLAPDGSNNFDAKSYDQKMSELLLADGQDFFASYDEVHETFDSMGLQENLLRGIYAYGFEKPSAIQQRGIVPFCKGLDVIQQAQSGTGKTATFCSGILQQLDYALVECQALVLAPTRELAQQIEKVMRALGDYLGVKVHACVGGTSVREDQRILSSGVHVVVGTPGRVFDMLRRQSLRADSIKMFVLDEADEMLSRGFKDQIYDIFQLLPPKIQVGVFSATMPPEALDITRKFMNKPVRILVKREELTLEGIKQFHVNVDKEEWKLETLCDLYETLAITQSVIFVNTRRKVDWLTDKMRSRDHTVSATHGDMDQNTRDIIMREFRSGSSRVLITTDLLARGIDVQQVSLVINYDLPTQPENYLHRIGRGGRFGRKGVAINFVTKDDERMLFDIQKFYNVVIEELPANVADLL
ncbi:unnamed protein product [Linum tenue]|uniref:RNA helicase n=1 Tax=Linum tenue TaxID=586396 RepID=A0AAV0HQ00_9ROSI|nr:unnamed protein product [Linum tenue]